MLVNVEMQTCVTWKYFVDIAQGWQKAKCIQSEFSGQSLWARFSHQIEVESIELAWFSDGRSKSPVFINDNDTKKGMTNKWSWYSIQSEGLVIAYCNHGFLEVIHHPSCLKVLSANHSRGWFWRTWLKMFVIDIYPILNLMAWLCELRDKLFWLVWSSGDPNSVQHFLARLVKKYNWNQGRKKVLLTSLNRKEIHLVEDLKALWEDIKSELRLTIGMKIGLETELKRK